jgi:hypothetical protein
MKALRQNVHVSQSLLHLVLPKEFDNCDVEVIVLAENQKPIDSFNPSKFVGLTDMSIDKMNADLRSLRSEWDRPHTCI